MLGEAMNHVKLQECQLEFAVKLFRLVEIHWHNPASSQDKISNLILDILKTIEDDYFLYMHEGVLNYGHRASYKYDLAPDLSKLWMQLKTDPAGYAKYRGKILREPEYTPEWSKTAIITKLQGLEELVWRQVSPSKTKLYSMVFNIGDMLNTFYELIAVETRHLNILPNFGDFWADFLSKRGEM